MKPETDFYSLDCAAEFLTESVEQNYSYTTRDIERYILSGQLVSCVESKAAGRRIYLDTQMYQDRGMSLNSLVGYESPRDVRMGNTVLMGSGSELLPLPNRQVEVPIQELKRLLSNPEACKNTHANLVREMVESCIGKKTVVVPQVISLILIELETLVPGFGRCPMRGNVEDFHWFCSHFSSLIKGIPNPETFRRYCKGESDSRTTLCSWGHQKPAADRGYWEGIVNEWERNT